MHVDAAHLCHRQWRVEWPGPGKEACAGWHWNSQWASMAQGGTGHWSSHPPVSSPVADWNWMMTLPWLIATLAACCSVLIILAFFGTGNRVAMMRLIGGGSDGSVDCSRESGGARCGKSHFNHRYFSRFQEEPFLNPNKQIGEFSTVFVFATRPSTGTGELQASLSWHLEFRAEGLAVITLSFRV